MVEELSLKVQTNKTRIPVMDSQQLVYVLIGAMPAGVMSNVQMPINFCFVLDHSGSMSGQKLSDLKQAAKLAVDRMTGRDLISIIVFDENADVIVPAQAVEDPKAIKRRIDAIREGGGTSMSAGMRVGLNELAKGVSPERVSRMLVLTDGETFGDEQECRRLAVDAAQMGVSIAALGLGEDWNMNLLDSIGKDSGGHSDFIPQNHTETILNVFDSSVKLAQGTVLQKVELLLRLASGVTPRQVWRVVPLITRLDPRVISDRDVQVSLGDLAKDQGQSVLVELLIPPHQPGIYRVAQAEVAYQVSTPPSTERKTRSDVVVEFTADATLTTDSNPYVMNIVEKVTAHKLQTRALNEAEAGNLVAATQNLKAAATRLLELGEDELARSAVQEMGNLDQEGHLSAAGTRKLRYETRKLVRTGDG